MEACSLFFINRSDTITGSRDEIELEAMNPRQTSWKFSVCLGVKVLVGLSPNGQRECAKSESNSMFFFVFIVMIVMATAAKLGH